MFVVGCLMMQGLSSGTCMQSKSSGSNNSSFKHMYVIPQEHSSINRLLTLNFTYGGGGGGGGTFVFLVSFVHFFGMLVAISLLHSNSKLLFCRWTRTMSLCHCWWLLVEVVWVRAIVKMIGLNMGMDWMLVDKTWQALSLARVQQVEWISL